MGISDDIKPRKVYNYTQKKQHEPSKKDSSDIELSKNNSKDGEIPATPLQNELENYLNQGEYVYENKKELENDFFVDESTKNNHKQKQKKHRFKFPTKLVTWIIVLSLIGVAVNKNSNKIIDLITGQTTDTTETTAKDESYVSENTSTNNSATAETTTTETPKTETVSTATTPNKSDIKIEVLNGNGISGSADKVRDQLVGAGFTVAKIANAKKFTYASTYIYYKTGAEASMELVKSALSTRTCITQLSDSITTGYDIVVVVGKK